MIEPKDNLFSDTWDLVIRKLTIKQTGEKALFVYLDGLTDKTAINHDVLRRFNLRLGVEIRAMSS